MCVCMRPNGQGIVGKTVQCMFHTPQLQIPVCQRSCKNLRRCYTCPILQERVLIRCPIPDSVNPQEELLPVTDPPTVITQRVLSDDFFFFFFASLFFQHQQPDHGNSY